MTTANVGNYDVIVANAYGSVTSSVAVMSLRTPPSITAQPQSRSTAAGSTVILTVTAAGSTPIFYQWRFNGTNVPSDIITTVAGGGGSGDGSVATNAYIWNPTAAAVDASGNLFIADALNSRIRKVSTNGIIVTVAGNGRFGYSRDGIPATAASLNEPLDVDVDASGNFFIADLYKQSRSPGGNQRHNHDGGRRRHSWLFRGRGTATNASFNGTAYVVVRHASGNLFIADYYNSCVREVSTNGIITTVAGNGSYGYSGRTGVSPPMPS